LSKVSEVTTQCICRKGGSRIKHTIVEYWGEGIVMKVWEKKIFKMESLKDREQGQWCEVKKGVRRIDQPKLL
tara:strand:+ start:828 stop:1043 length:216 start_codon:yes stop_codon:yes gene_type:complete